MKRCVLCGKPITPSFWVCADCEKRWNFDNKDFTEWPEWVRAIVSIERRNVYVDKNLEIIFTDDLDEFLKGREHVRKL